MIGQTLRVGLHLECTVCLRNRDEEEIADAMTEAALFGRKTYATCPSCFRRVFEMEFDPEYRRRVRVWLFENRGVVLRVP